MVLERSDRVDFTLAGRRAPPRRVDRVALPELRSRQCALDAQRADRRRSAQGSPQGCPAISATAASTGTCLAATGADTSDLASAAPGPSAALGYYSGGDRPRRINIGGTLGLRGYPQFGYIVGSPAFMFNQELRFPLLTHLTLGTPVGDLDFPEIQAGLFTDVGKAPFPTGTTARCSVVTGLASAWRWDRLRYCGSIGAAVQRRRFRGYGLTAEQRNPGFVQLLLRL